MEKLILNVKHLGIILTQLNINLHTLIGIQENKQRLNKFKFRDEVVLSEIETFSEALREPIVHMLIIRYKSFLDEYNNYFDEKKIDNLDLKARIQKVINKNQYGLTFIKNNWKDLSDFRSQISAHHFRDFSKKSFFEISDREFSIPIYLDDHKIIFYILERIYKNIYNEFPELNETMIENTLESKISFKKKILNFQYVKLIIDKNM